MKAKYHRFTGDVPIVFVEDALDFMKKLGAEINEDNKPYDPVFMQEVTIGPLKMLVFSEAIMRTLQGGVRTPTIEAHLALWKGTQKHPTNEVKALRYALAITERYNRKGAHGIIRSKLSSLGKKVNEFNAAKTKTMANRPIESILFTEGGRASYIHIQRILSEAVTVPEMKKLILSMVNAADENVLRKVFAILSKDNAAYHVALAIMTSIGIPESNARTVLDRSLETGDFPAFSRYMTKRTLTLAAVSKSGDLIAAAKAAIPSMSDQFAMWLINYNWPSTPLMGAGEAALVLLLKNGNKPAHGDIAIGDDVLEVKGDNGRLKGQHGYGTGMDVGKVFETEFNKLMRKLPAADRIAIPAAGGTEYNATKTARAGWAANRLARHVVGSGVASKSDIVKIWKKAVSAMYLEMGTGWVAQFITDTGEIHDITGFLHKWLEEASHYYMRREKFKAMILVSRLGKLIVINPSDFAKIGQTVNWSPPNFGSRAGPQGAAFGVTVKQEMTP